MNYGINIRPEGALDFVSIGALIHRHVAGPQKGVGRADIDGLADLVLCSQPESPGLAHGQGHRAVFILHGRAVISHTA